MKKVVLAVLAMIMVCSAVVYAVTLTDIEGHWAEGYITELVEKGVINGYEDGTYRPQGVIKKAEFLKLIMTASLPDEDWTIPGFKYDHWATAYIEVAEIEGILEDGEINAENANDPISRAQVVEILGRCDLFLRNAKQIGREVEFYDVDDISDDAYTMLCHCVGQGYITGYEDATFKPDNTLTRAESATILSRYLNK